MKKILAFFTLIFLFALVGCTANEKVFDKGDFKITLTDEFKEDSHETVTYFFLSNKIGVSALRESFDDLAIVGLDSESSLEEYTNAVLRANEKNSEFKKEDNFYYFTYDSEVDGTTYHYLSALFKGENNFWLVNFFGLKNNLEKTFLEYARTIKVK